MRFAILVCGHWVGDPHKILAVGDPAPCPRGDWDQTVIALPDSATTMMEDQDWVIRP